MFNPQTATNYEAIKSLVESYNTQWNGKYSMYAIINIWALKKTIGYNKVNVRVYYAYQNQNGTIQYWNADFIHDICKNTYTYILGSGNYASASDNGLTIKQQNNHQLYFYNPRVYPLDTIKNRIVQFSRTF